MRTVRVDGSPGSVSTLGRELAAALDGGPAILPCLEDPGPVPDPIVPTALVVGTSGSTGAPRWVALSGAALLASAAATHRRLGGPGRWLLALPAHHIAGAQVIVRALVAGAPPTVLDTREGFRADRFAAAAEALARLQPRYTSLVPTQLHRVLADPTALRALLGFDAVLVGGAACPPRLLSAARDAGVNAVTTYGMSETAGGCVYDGVPLDCARVRLRDGHVELAGTMLAHGYLGDPAATATAFAAGWLRTSDLGRWEPDGRLSVLGRADDVITTGGESVHPAAVERVLLAQPGVRAACVVAVPDPEWGQLVAAAVVWDGGDGAPDQEAWAAAVRAHLGGPSVPRRVRLVPELPLRGVGKPDRTAVTALLGRDTDV